jgi:hypothetical protein
MLTFILACYGLTMILVYSKILNTVRPNWEVLKCTMCTGFWVGILMSFWLDTEFGGLIGGFISSGTSYFISKLIDDDGILVKIKNVELIKKTEI